ncbi:cysteine desulfurase family protein [Cohnella terricola]|uniref:Cysteine desulfurase n=1 Tax=Cohnella terricola TaxID=1289167 RepID=A0A559JL13_9BACL|nr:cysteine desulfurase family protein [Cohnella terricola]TVY00554.1 cysteine desulfurase [Cohnella terricola]
MKTYYFDHCASSPMLPRVVETMTELMKLQYANASALHRSGVEAMKLADRARSSVAERMGALPQEVVFTSGGTESNNLAIKGAVNKAARTIKHVIVSEVEHASVYECARQLEAEGVQLTVLPVDESGRVDPNDVARAIKKETVLVSVMHVNNETGTIQPIREIGEIVAGHPHVKFHVDGVQAIGKVPIDWKRWGVHLYTGSAHKFGGPKGAGFLLVKDGVELKPLFGGGNQEQGLRSGTLNVPAIVSMSQALRLTMESQNERRQRMYAMKRRLQDIVAKIPEFVVNGIPTDAVDPETLAAPHVVNISYPGMRPEVMIHMLETQGILVSTQSACSSKTLQPSRVLLAMGHNAERASGSLRISFGDEHGMEDIEILGERLVQVVSSLKTLERNMK